MRAISPGRKHLYLLIHFSDLNSRLRSEQGFSICPTPSWWIEVICSTFLSLFVLFCQVRLWYRLLKVILGFSKLQCLTHRNSALFACPFLFILPLINIIENFLRQIQIHKPMDFTQILKYFVNSFWSFVLDSEMSFSESMGKLPQLIYSGLFMLSCPHLSCYQQV